MRRGIVFLIFALMVCLVTSLRAADTNSLVWQTSSDRVSADIRSEPLWTLLQTVARQTGWRIFVEPGTTHTVSAKFKDLSSGDALRMLLGDLNFALVPQTNAPSQLYVFRTSMQNATRPVSAVKRPRYVPNELLIRVKPGTDIEALAKLVGAKVVGRIDKLNVYLLQFPDAATMEAALAQLNSDSDVLDVGYNYYFDPPSPAKTVSSTPVSPLSLQLDPPGKSGKVIVGMIDTHFQSQALDAQLNQFMLPEISVAGQSAPDNSDITHATAMAYAILEAMAESSGGSTSAQILPVNVYGNSTTATSWDVALGIQAAVNAGATVINLSLGGPDYSAALNNIIQQTINDGIPVFAAAGNDPVSTPNFPAADPRVISVTALGQSGQLASYANSWSGNQLALPGTSFAYFGSQAYLVEGTSTSTAYATGYFAGKMAASGMNATQIMPMMYQEFPVPGK